MLQSYSSASNRRARIQVLSLVVPHFTYPQLARYNIPSFSNVVANEDEDDEDPENDVTLQLGEVFFNPPITARQYRNAKIHYYENGVSKSIFRFPASVPNL